MTVIDTYGWVEYFCDSQLADDYEKFILDKEKVLIPTIVIYETFKVLTRLVSEEITHNAIHSMQEYTVIPLTTELALAAAKLSLQTKLAMADSIVYATARHHKADLVTGDPHFKGMEFVTWIG